MIFPLLSYKNAVSSSSPGLTSVAETFNSIQHDISLCTLQHGGGGGCADNNLLLYLENYTGFCNKNVKNCFHSSCNIL